MIGAVLRLLGRRHRISLTATLLAPVALGFVAGAIYPDLAAQREALASIPFIARFLDSEFAEPFSPASILVLPYQHPLSLVLWAVLPAIPALGLLAGERGRGSLDMLLATPLERRRLVAAIGLFQFLLLPVALCSPFAGTWIAGWMADESAALPPSRLWMAGVNLAGLIGFWGGASLMVSVLSRDRVAATFAYAVTVFVVFALDSASRLATGAAWMASWTPYGYYRPADVVSGSEAWGARGGGLLAAGIVLALLAMELQHRRRSA